MLRNSLCRCSGANAISEDTAMEIADRTLLARGVVLTTLGV